LTKFHEKYKARGFQVLAVDAYDHETREQVQEFARNLKLTHPIVLTGEKASDLYEVQQQMPMAFWIDSKGTIVRRDLGFHPEMEKETERTIVTLLDQRDAEAGKGAPRPASPN